MKSFFAAALRWIRPFASRSLALDALGEVEARGVDSVVVVVVPLEPGAFRSCALTFVPSLRVYSLTWTVLPLPDCAFAPLEPKAAPFELDPLASSWGGAP